MESKEVKKEEVKEVVKNFGDKIWDEIKGVRLDIFGLPNQTTEMYCKKVVGTTNSLLVQIKVSAALPALENSLPEFEFEIANDNKTVTIKRKGK